MNEWFVPIAGGILVLIGLALMRAHVRSWNRQKNDPQLNNADYSHLFARYRRRLQTSGMIAVLGVMIAAGYQLPNWKNRPGLFGLYWLAVLILTFWVMLLALGDYYSTRSHARTSMAQFRKKQRELERQIAGMKRRQSNGQDASD